VVGVFSHERSALITSGTVKVEPLISHQLPLDDFRHGLELAEKDPKRVKIHFYMT